MTPTVNLESVIAHQAAEIERLKAELAASEQGECEGIKMIQFYRAVIKAANTEPTEGDRLDPT